MLRRGVAWPWQLAMLAALVTVSFFFVRLIGSVDAWAASRWKIFISLTGLAFWRWGWASLQFTRAAIYRGRVFPRIRRQAQLAEELSGPVPEVTVMVVTYREKEWVTAAVFESILAELTTISSSTGRARIVVATGCDDDDVHIRRVYDRFRRESGPFGPHPELTLLREERGKRPALVAAMEEIIAAHPDPDGVVVFMDGDTVLAPGSLRKVVPFFRLTPAIDAVTTNEAGVVKGPGWFCEWISLRMAQRHLYMCSVALSGTLLCLTGRLSIYRASVVLDPTFRHQVHRDVLDHWLWDTYEMFSGDDKSTWYWLAAHRRRVLYVPDAVATTIEVVDGNALRRAAANLRRWSGNSFSNSWRGIRLGPRRLGLFPWWGLIDQRLSIVTTLVGPLTAFVATLCGRYDIAAGYLLWAIVTRHLRAAAAWIHGRRFSAFYAPLLVLSEWIGSAIKLWVSFHPARQTWLNRGARMMDSTRAAGWYPLRRVLAYYTFAVSWALLLVVISVSIGFLPILREAPLFLGGSASRHAVRTWTRPSPAGTARGGADGRVARPAVWPASSDAND